MWPLVLSLLGEFFKNQKINVANFHEGLQKYNKTLQSLVKYPKIM